MTEPFQHPISRGGALPARRGDSLADVLERVLDKGIVIAGDIRVDLLDIELLTIRIRLLISSADKAQELGMAWWRNDPFFTGELPADAPSSDSSSDSGSRQDERQEIGDGETDALQRLVEGTEELSRRVAELEAGRQEASGPTGSSAQVGEANEPHADRSDVEGSGPRGAQ